MLDAKPTLLMVGPLSVVNFAELDLQFLVTQKASGFEAYQILHSSVSFDYLVMASTFQPFPYPAIDASEPWLSITHPFELVKICANQLQGTKIAMCTAQADGSDEQADLAKKHGIDGIIPQPLVVAQLLAL